MLNIMLLSTCRCRQLPSFAPWYYRINAFTSSSSSRRPLTVTTTAVEPVHHHQQNQPNRPNQHNNNNNKIPFYGLPRSHIETTTATVQQRWMLAATSAVSAWWDPTRANDVAALGNVTSTYALHQLQHVMRQHPIGQRILQDRPLVHQDSLPQWMMMMLEQPSSLDDEHDDSNESQNNNPNDNSTIITFGQAYAAFMRQHGFDPNDRSPVEYIDDPELAYIMLRYRQCHDYWHVLTGLPPTVLGEIAIKWLELFQTGLPVAALSATAGTFRLTNHSERSMVWHSYMPWALRVSQQITNSSNNLMNVYYEEEFDTPLDDLRQRLNIEPAPMVSS